MPKPPAGFVELSERPCYLTSWQGGKRLADWTVYGWRKKTKPATLWEPTQQPISDYERKRQERMRQNAAVMHGLGVVSALQHHRQCTHKAAEPKAKLKATEAEEVTRVTPVKTRSGRNASKTEPSTPSVPSATREKSTNRTAHLVFQSDAFPDIEAVNVFHAVWGPTSLQYDEAENEGCKYLGRMDAACCHLEWPQEAPFMGWIGVFKAGKRPNLHWKCKRLEHMLYYAEVQSTEAGVSLKPVSSFRLDAEKQLQSVMCIQDAASQGFFIKRKPGIRIPKRLQEVGNLLTLEGQLEVHQIDPNLKPVDSTDHYDNRINPIVTLENL